MSWERGLLWGVCAESRLQGKASGELETPCVIRALRVRGLFGLQMGSWLLVIRGAEQGGLGCEGVGVAEQG